MAAIETLGLEKHYSVGFWRKVRRDALRPLTLSVEQGEVFGYLGPNGAGKTTTLRLLMGLVFPSGGSARILGCALDDPSMKARIGFLPEQPYFYDHLTPRELLHYYAQLSGVAAKEISKRTEIVLERVGMSGSGNVQMKKLSKGMLQRVGIAQAIVHDPELLFLDEPMSGLDPIGRREVRDLIEELNNEGKTIFFSTHILSDAETLCDRVAVLNRGTLRGIGVVADLIRDVSGRVEVTWHGKAPVPSIEALAVKAHVTGDISRVEVNESQAEAVVDDIRKAGMKLLSLSPVHASLEDYFLQQLKPEQEDTPTVEASR
jgi:ABC-2 type transport system ATP-binding protein